MLDQAELTQVRKYLIRVLPQVLTQEPEIATVIEGILARQFPRRDEFARLLDEVTAHRKESSGRFELFESSFEAHYGETTLSFERAEKRTNDLESHLQAHRIETGQHFDKLETRVDGLESHLQAHRTETGQRFDKLETRVNDLESHLQAHRIETREGFDQVDRRFDQIDPRFDQVDDRFEQVDDRFGKIEAKFDDHGTRLERLEGFSLDAKRRLFKLEAGQERIIRRLDQQEQWLKLMVGQLGDEKGHDLEDLMAVALAYGLKNPQITPESIRLRQTLIDKDGLVFKRGFKTEVDLIAVDDRLTVFSVFEVKASLKSSDVDIFSLKIELVAAQNPDKKVHGLIIALGRYSGARKRCEEYGIELLP